MVEWDFLKAFLLKLGFSGRLLSWVMQGVTIVSLSVKFKGMSKPSFYPTSILLCYRLGDQSEQTRNVFQCWMSKSVEENMALEMRIPEIAKTGKFLGIALDLGHPKK